MYINDVSRIILEKLKLEKLTVVFQSEVLKYEPGILGDIYIGQKEECEPSLLGEPSAVYVSNEQDEFEEYKNVSLTCLDSLQITVIEKVITLVYGWPQLSP